MIQAYQWELRPFCLELKSCIKVVGKGVDKLTQVVCSGTRGVDVGGACSFAAWSVGYAQLNARARSPKVRCYDEIVWRISNIK